MSTKQTFYFLYFLHSTSILKKQQITSDYINANKISLFYHIFITRYTCTKTCNKSTVYYCFPSRKRIGTTGKNGNLQKEQNKCFTKATIKCAPVIPQLCHSNFILASILVKGRSACSSRNVLRPKSALPCDEITQTQDATKHRRQSQLC